VAALFLAPEVLYQWTRWLSVIKVFLNKIMRELFSCCVSRCLWHSFQAALQTKREPGLPTRLSCHRILAHQNCVHCNIQSRLSCSKWRTLLAFDKEISCHRIAVCSRFNSCKEHVNSCIVECQCTDANACVMFYMHAAGGGALAWAQGLLSILCTASSDGTPRGYRAGCCVPRTTWIVAPWVATGVYTLSLAGCILVGSRYSPRVRTSVISPPPTLHSDGLSYDCMMPVGGSVEDCSNIV
jgi:hypothetical protein